MKLRSRPGRKQDTPKGRWSFTSLRLSSESGCEHLRAGAPGTQSWLQHLTGVTAARGGATHAVAGRMALKLLQETASTQAPTLAYADAFFAMAALACVAVVFLTIVPPSPPAKKLLG